MKPHEILQHLSGNSLSNLDYIYEAGKAALHPKWKVTTGEIVKKIAGHMSGVQRIGFSAMTRERTSNWFAIDVDNSATHTTGVADFDGTCNYIRTNLHRFGLKYLEVFSRSGRGKHFYVLADSRLPADALRDLASAIVPSPSIEIFPKPLAQERPHCIFVPFFGAAGKPEADVEYDLLNDANHIRQLASQFSGRYEASKPSKPRRVLVRNPKNTISAVTAVTPSRVVTATTQDEIDYDRQPQPVDMINAELQVSDYKPVVDNRYRKKHASVSIIDGKERHGHDWSDLTKTFSTHTVVVPDLLEGQYGRGETRTVLRSAPVFNTEEFYQGQFRLARRIKGLVPFTTVSELNRYLAQREAERDTDNLFRNSADWSLRSTRSVYGAYTRIELINDTQAIVHILFKEPPQGVPNIQWRAFTLPINNKRFVSNIRQGANVYTIGTDKWVGDDGKDQTGRYSVKVGIKPTDTNPPTE